MLPVNDYNHIKTLYEQFRKCNSLIRSLMEENDWDSVETAVAEKNNILKKIIFFEKPRLNEIKENIELNSMRLELIELEKQNLELVKEKQAKLSKEISQVHNVNKIRNAYEPVEIQTDSTLDVSDSD